MLDNGNIIFPIQMIKIFYNFIKEDDHETVANLIWETWYDMINAQYENPTIENYIDAVKMWASTTEQNFQTFENGKIKHVMHHNWNLSYSKITSTLFRNVFGTFGYRMENIEIRNNMFAYHLVKV